LILQGTNFSDLVIQQRAVARTAHH